MENVSEPDFGQQDADVGQPAEEASTPRVRSTIAFPYVRLEDAEAVARAVQEIGGGAAEWGAVGVKLDASPTGGAFRQKMLASRMYGLLTYKGQQVNLTDSGRRIIDVNACRDERVTAFMNIPLFRKAYEEWKNVELPPAPAIERRMADWGVAPKQADKARQVFMRSAKFAGFFDLAPNKMVMPSTSAQLPVDPPEGTPPPPPPPPGDLKARRRGGSGGGETPALHPLVDGLLSVLPPENTAWPRAKRVKWLETAANIFEMIYEDDVEASDIVVKVTREPPNGGHGPGTRGADH